MSKSVNYNDSGRTKLREGVWTTKTFDINYRCNSAFVIIQNFYQFGNGASIDFSMGCKGIIKIEDFANFRHEYFKNCIALVHLGF